jgi:hypothetical protein
MRTILAAGGMLVLFLLGLAGGLAAGSEGVHSTVTTTTVAGTGATQILTTTVSAVGQQNGATTVTETGAQSTATHTITTTIGGGATVTQSAIVTTTVSAAGGGVTTATVTVTSLHEGASLVEVNGTGQENSAPFTASSSQVALNWTLSNAGPDTLVNWFIYPVNSTTLYVQTGGVTASNGTQSSLAYGLTPGQQYYVAVLAANCVWSVTVNPIS